MSKLYTYPYAVLNQYRPLTKKYGTEYGVDPTLIDALIWRESRGNPNATNATAKGLTQFTPIAMKQWGVVDPFDPAQAIEGTAKYLGHYAYAGAAGALQAYNAGAPGRHTERIGGNSYEDAVISTAQALEAQSGAVPTKGSLTASVAVSSGAPQPPAAAPPAPEPPRVPALPAAVASATPAKRGFFARAWERLRKPRSDGDIDKAFVRLRRWLRKARSGSGSDMMS